MPRFIQQRRSLVFYATFSLITACGAEISEPQSPEVAQVAQAAYGAGDTVGVFASNTFYLDRDGNCSLESTFPFGGAYGGSAPTPLVGNWEGLSRDTLGISYAWGPSYYHIIDLNYNWISDTGDKHAGFGLAGDKSLSGRWTNNGQDMLAVYRAEADGIEGAFYLDTGDDWGPTAVKVVFGLANDIPLAGNWSGTAGKDCIGVYRPSEGMFRLDYNCNNKWDGPDNGDKFYKFFSTPDSADLPVVGDWAGTGQDKIGIYRTSTSAPGRFYLDRNGNGVWNGAAYGDTYCNTGVAGMPVAGKW
jgi:hypothetical protein